MTSEITVRGTVIGRRYTLSDGGQALSVVVLQGARYPQDTSDAGQPADWSIFDEQPVENGPLIVIADLNLLAADIRAVIANRIAKAGMRVITIEPQQDPATCETLVRSGYAGILPPDAPPTTYFKAIRAVAEGQLWFPREVISRVLKGFLIEEDLSRLTAREAEILRLIGMGMKNREIANELFISRETVRWHVRGLNAKLGITDRSSVRDLVRYLGSKDKMPVTASPQRRQSLAS